MGLILSGQKRNASCDLMRPVCNTPLQADPIRCVPTPSSPIPDSHEVHSRYPIPAYQSRNLTIDQNDVYRNTRSDRSARLPLRVFFPSNMRAHEPLYTASEGKVGT